MYADIIFSRDPHTLGQSAAWMGAVCYGFQIFFDFSAYSDMAIGMGRISGFHFLENFNAPYRANSITDFWRRWHISLSTWFRDYLYIPMGGNKKGKIRTAMNLLVVFFLCGIWHGAGWTFVMWGLWHGFFLLSERIIGLKTLDKIPSLIRRFYVLITITLSWVLFRAPALGYAVRYIRLMLMGQSQTVPTFLIGFITDRQLIITLILASTLTFIPMSILKTQLLNLKIPFSSVSSPHEYLPVFECLLIPFLFIVCTVYIVSGTYSPFIYFRF